VSKLYFAYGLGNSLFFPLLAGCRAVLHAGHPRPPDVAALVERHGVTVLFSVPTFYAHLVAGGRREALRSVRVAVSAGEALGVELASRARAFLGCPILDGLGSTEVGQTFASNTLEECRDGTVGRPLPPYRARIDDGVLWVSGPTLPLGHAGDWLCTGDQAFLDDDGFLHLQGRTDDIEQVGGISVVPMEIEEVLCRHPAVTEVAVAGVVGADGASQLEAFVVTGLGAPPANVVQAELVALARPRTPTGKLRRFVLRSGGWGAGDQDAKRSM
jgi:fatty-acyl-CoA synthase/fatty acid CoA ligase FadD22